MVSKNISRPLLDLRGRRALAWLIVTLLLVPGDLPATAQEEQTAPEIAELTRDRFPVSGGDIEIYGTGFTGLDEVRFGDAVVECEGPNARCLANGDGWILSEVPAHAPGKVPVTVVVDGVSSSAEDAPEVEFFPTNNGTWQACSGAGPSRDCPAPIGTGRTGHTATLLDGPQCRQVPEPSYCGKVLVAGGQMRAAVGAPPVVLSSAELYDPATGTWSATGSLNVGRHTHSATLLLDGRVLVVGGSTAAGASNQDEQPIASADLYDPATGNWTSCSSGQAGPDCPGPLKVARYWHTATLLEAPGCGANCGKVLVSGGGYIPLLMTSSNHTTPTAELYDPDSGTWRDTGSLMKDRQDHRATLLNSGACRADPVPVWCGKILVTGGDTDTGSLNAVGSYCSNCPVREAELYDPVEERWSSCPRAEIASATCPAPALRQRDQHDAALLPGGRVLIAGNNENRRDAEIYDASTGKWTATPLMNSTRHDPTLTRLPSGEVLAAGGWIEWFRASAEMYSGGTWSYTPYLTASRQSHTATLLRDGRVLVVGGTAFQKASLGHDTVWVRATDLFTPAPSVTAVAPNLVPAVGGVELEVFGSGFTATNEVVVGDVAVPASELSINASGTSISLMAPAATTQRTVGVRVTNPGGTDVLADAITYTGPPGAVGSLKAEVAADDRVVLSFDAPGEVALTNPPAREYEIVQSAQPITDENVAGALNLCSPNPTCSYTPASVGDRLTFEVRDLRADRTYHYAVRAKAEGLLGPLAVTSIEMPRIPPGAITSLGAMPLSHNEIRLEFPAAGMDGNKNPPATEYIVKQGAAPFSDDAGFGAAASLCDGGICRFSPAAVGDKLILDVKNLTPDTTYYYAIKARDDNGNDGPMSEVVAVKTLAAPELTAVTDLAAEVLSDDSIKLSFSAPGIGGRPATRYIIKQSQRAIDGETDFDDARALCGGTCTFEPSAAGDRINLTITDLEPGTTYFYALKHERADGTLGPMSNVARATLPGDAPATISYPAGYALLGLPAGTVAPADGPLYSWFNRGAGGRYSVSDSRDALKGARGYWAYFSRPVEISVLPGKAAATLRLGAYKASMVGNPSGRRELRATGFDFAARWDPGLNGGEGGYRISAYRAPQRLGIGQGMWVFSYSKTRVSMKAR